MSINHPLDLLFAKETGEQIDEYVHTEVLYYPVGPVGGVQLPLLTIGTWLEVDWRLSAGYATLKPEQQATVDKARSKVQRVRSRAQELYRQKARREFKSRLDTWTWYLDELLAREPAAVPPEGQAYATQVHVRFKLELLKADCEQVQDQLARLIYNDRRLRLRYNPGEFVWEPELAPCAPPDVYWWLYGRPA